MSPPINLTFAIADLHGRLDLFDRAISSINQYADGAGAHARTIVCLGDYVDRGPDSCGVIERLMELRSCLRFRLVCLLGKHDSMMKVSGCKLFPSPARHAWIAHGGDATLKSYERERFSGHPHRAHIDWLDGLPLYFEDEHRVYVYAQVNPRLPLSGQRQYILLWQPYADDEPGGYRGRHVVHGHTPNPNGPLQFSGRTALDTLAWRTGRLVVGVFDDALLGGPIDLIEVQGEPYGAGGQR
jgi:serine/threonine protein phosphatase 1